MKSRTERGSAMIEAALIFSLLIGMVFGLADFGRYLLAYHFAGYAAREATRFASVHGKESLTPATSESVERLVKDLAMGVDPATLHVKTEWTPDNTPGSIVRVEVDTGSVKAASQVTVLH